MKEKDLRIMKKILHMIVAVMLMALMLVTPVMASETCELSDGTACDIWMFHNNEGHWRACVNHRDEKGNDTIMGEAEEHIFEEGVCTVCEAKESKGAGAYSYLFVFIVVVGLSALIPMRMQKSFKKNNFEERPFGLDKYRRF